MRARIVGQEAAAREVQAFELWARRQVLDRDVRHQRAMLKIHCLEQRALREGSSRVVR